MILNEIAKSTMRSLLQGYIVDAQKQFGLVNQKLNISPDGTVLGRDLMGQPRYFPIITKSDLNNVDLEQSGTGIFVSRGMFALFSYSRSVREPDEVQKFHTPSELVRACVLSQKNYIRILLLEKRIEATGESLESIKEDIVRYYGFIRESEEELEAILDEYIKSVKSKIYESLIRVAVGFI